MAQVETQTVSETCGMVYQMVRFQMGHSSDVCVGSLLEEDNFLGTLVAGPRKFDNDFARGRAGLSAFEAQRSLPNQIGLNYERSLLYFEPARCGCVRRREF
jgi:hypothetical protein